MGKSFRDHERKGPRPGTRRIVKGRPMVWTGREWVADRMAGYVPAEEEESER